MDSEGWLALGRYAREVLAAQDTRRFVLGFTLCGPLMRLWEFDRLGGIASESFDINKDGLQFVFTILGFLRMNEEDFGFDPSVVAEEGQRFVVIKRGGRTERLVIDKLVARKACVAGRATTCWRAHREEDPQTHLFIKDSWQDIKRDEEGDLLREATEKGVVNVARYCHHETVQVRGTDDDIQSNARDGLDVTTATNYQPERSMPSPTTVAFGASWEGSSSAAGEKRPYGQLGTPLPPSNSRSAILATLEGCIKGHESLHEVGFLHRDISINNLMINKDMDNPSWSSFLIDLDLAVRERREDTSRAKKGRAGTLAFMAVGVLLGEKHSFMHDLESFFWVLLWICLRYDGPHKWRDLPKYHHMNYVVTMESSACQNKGQVIDERDFIRYAEERFTPHCQPLVPWVNRLRRVVFPNGRRWETEDVGLYAWMRDVIGRARKDPKVLAEDSLTV
ncbi:hypothetical protein MAPG_10438 [Magnaporthiopsis poae ATCC 64411]|uniref:non-specific serine/threonine protein kinase n=1 Tax=Magnaporthiopsis poae (strain ATCC 64411 / 73-15) TaxID=644358 RepID=A0A0C4ECK9_MAGP6|nr:hypothetical protein MAPG_10438 [Magnaporthiopsis poae ATCC 64411]